MPALSRIVVVLLALPCCAGAAGHDGDSVIDRLAASPVSRLDWGMERLHRALIAHFERDPVTLEPSAPPYFINAGFEQDDGVILIEIGRTLPTIARADAKRECEDYIARVRSFLSVTRLGNPSVGSTSALMAEYFHPSHAPDEPAAADATALDALVRVRALVASPLNGVYSICTANLTNSPVRHIE